MTNVVSEFKVELRQQTIPKKTSLGVVAQRIAQSQVVVNGKVVAHVCDHDNAPVNFCDTSLPPELRDVIVAKVAALRDKPVRMGGAPPDPETVAEIIRELDPNRDDDDDDDNEYSGAGQHDY